MLTHVDVRQRTIAIIGNPNSGKTTMFNALTGLRQKVANYPGVTVEKKEGVVLLPDGSECLLIDLPGTYSLSAHSPDEKIATEVLLGRQEQQPPDLVICVVDASNLERNLYLVSQIIDYHLPLLVVLNMMDVAQLMNVSIDHQKLSEELDVPIIPAVASKGLGLDELRNAILDEEVVSKHSRRWKLPAVVQEECEELRDLIQAKHEIPEALAFHEAITLLTSPQALADHEDRFDTSILVHVRKDHEKLSFLGFDCQSLFVEARYAWIKEICSRSVKSGNAHRPTLSDRIDRILMHKVWGFLIFFAVMGFMFQAIFNLATTPMEAIGSLFGFAGTGVRQFLPDGDLQDLIVNGVLGGVGTVVMFLPQILFLYLCIGLLEDTGYMARAAFIMDRLMSKVGLHGKSFIPLLSSFACAIPGIMATRTIENRNDRLATILVAPLISCSARLPVYALLIAAFIPHRTIWAIFNLQGLTLVALYVSGLLAALGMAWLLKKTLLKGEAPTFIMELPPYKLPSVRSILMQMRERALLFLRRAGTIILGVSIVLWFLATYPKLEGASPSDQLRHSFAGRAGQLIEPIIRPLGFDWKIGIGIVSSLLQREVFVSTMGTIYNINDSGSREGNSSLQKLLQKDINPETGAPSFTILTAICLMVYYLLAMQCMSTFAVVRRETNSWKWPLVQFGYMTALAYFVTFLVHRIGTIFL